MGKDWLPWNRWHNRVCQMWNYTLEERSEKITQQLPAFSQANLRVLSCHEGTLISKATMMWDGPRLMKRQLIGTPDACQWVVAFQSSQASCHSPNILKFSVLSPDIVEHIIILLLSVYILGPQTQWAKLNHSCFIVLSFGWIVKQQEIPWAQ